MSDESKKVNINVTIENNRTEEVGITPFDSLRRSFLSFAASHALREFTQTLIDREAESLSQRALEASTGGSYRFEGSPNAVPIDVRFPSGVACFPSSFGGILGNEAVLKVRTKPKVLSESGEVDYGARYLRIRKIK